MPTLTPAPVYPAACQAAALGLAASWPAVAAPRAGASDRRRIRDRLAGDRAPQRLGLARALQTRRRLRRHRLVGVQRGADVGHARLLLEGGEAAERNGRLGQLAGDAAHDGPPVLLHLTPDPRRV